jgi:urocanate hydratase
LGFDSQRRTVLALATHCTRQVTVADGTEAMAKRIERVLTTDPGMGIIRHADADYNEAKLFAKEKGVRVPMP